MTVTNKKRQWRLLEERARALATLLLTRRNDIEVLDVTSPETTVCHFLVRIRAKKRGLRQFGVILSLSTADMKTEDVDRLLSFAAKELHSVAPFPFPVVFFCYTAKADQAWYGWLTEPTVSDDGEVSLPVQEKVRSHPLNDAAVDSIITRVDHWYDAFYRRMSPTG